MLALFHTDRNESAIRVVAMSASASALVHSLSFSRSPSSFSAPIFICNPSNIKKNLFSLKSESHYYWICFAIANKARSALKSGIWLGFSLSLGTHRNNRDNKRMTLYYESTLKYKTYLLLFFIFFFLTLNNIARTV